MKICIPRHGEDDGVSVLYSVHIGSQRLVGQCLYMENRREGYCNSIGRLGPTLCMNFAAAHIRFGQVVPVNG